MDNKDKLLKQAIYILTKVYKHRLPGWPPCPQEEDLLTQEIEIYLKQFQPKNRRTNKYRQMDLDELIKQVLEKES